MPTVVSLFSGGGGLDLGFLYAGYRIIWAIDNNKNAVATYKENIGRHIKCADITEARLEEIPAADIVIGGPPCQSFSLAGMRHVEDSRGQLVWQYIRMIEHIKPKAFVFENVTGLLSSRNSRGEKVIEMLKTAFQDIGYTIETKIINAADYGVPQRRRRVIIVGLKGSGKFAFPNPTHNETGMGLKKYVTVQEALGDLPTAIEDEGGCVEYGSPPQNDYQEKMRSGNGSTVTEHFTARMSDLDKYIIAHVKPGGNYMDIPRDVNSKRIRRLQRDGGHTTCYGRMKPDEPSYTINTYFNRPNVGCNIHYAADRLITVREALRLQSFPDDYKIVSSFEAVISRFLSGSYNYSTTMEQLLSYMDSAIADDKRWKSSMAVLMYEYIREVFGAIRRADFGYDVRKFYGDVEQVCIEANKVDFDGIFQYDSTEYLPRLSIASPILSDAYSFGSINLSGDALADALHDKISENKRHDGEVATDPELALLASALARISNGELQQGKKICDPAAGSGNLICSSINVFHIDGSYLKANDINKKLLEFPIFNL